MKYDSLKRQPTKQFRVSAFDGGTNLQKAPIDIENNALSNCKNMWFKDGRLRTRPAFKGEVGKAVVTKVYYKFENVDYSVTDSVVFIDGVEKRIATADVLSDDSMHYTKVYLLDKNNRATSIGEIIFYRISSEVFYHPINILFYTGKSQTGGGIFALVTLRDEYDESKMLYNIYEVNSDYTQWERVYDYYVPVVYINGRGNKYQTAKLEMGLNLEPPKTLESPNMLSGRFNAYYTSDGYSNSFRLPYTQISNEMVVCRIYYNLNDYTEWKIPANKNADTQTFLSKSVTAMLQREKGVIYFTSDSGSVPIPIMDMCPENNIKITATKEIENGFSKIVHSTCSLNWNSKFLLSGGEDGNTVYVGSFEKPLYFPKNSSVTIGESNSEITGLSVANGKILAFKKSQIFALTLKNGKEINAISLLNDTDAVFKEDDTFAFEQISGTVGCSNKKTIKISGNTNFWFSDDGCIYALKSLSSREIVNVSKNINSGVSVQDFKYGFAVADDSSYMLVGEEEIIVCITENIEDIKLYLWECPECATLQNGYFDDGKLKFLCTGEYKTIFYIAEFAENMDSFFFYDSNGKIGETALPIECSFTTKHFPLSKKGERKNIESIELLMSAKSHIKIATNDQKSIKLNFGFSSEDYSKGDYKSVRLLPHLYGVDNVFLTVSSNHQMSVGEIEISYRILG